MIHAKLKKRRAFSFFTGILGVERGVLFVSEAMSALPAEPFPAAGPCGQLTERVGDSFDATASTHMTFNTYRRQLVYPRRSALPPRRDDQISASAPQCVPDSFPAVETHLFFGASGG